MQYRLMILLVTGVVVAATGIVHGAISDRDQSATGVLVHRSPADPGPHAPAWDTPRADIQVSTAVGVNTDSHLQLRGSVVVVIFGSEYLDVSEIELDSLTLERPAAGISTAADIPAVIDHVNDDNYPDLIITFPGPRDSTFSRLSVIMGQLADGTQISGQAVF
jgi:hypothetical protein